MTGPHLTLSDSDGILGPLCDGAGSSERGTAATCRRIQERTAREATSTEGREQTHNKPTCTTPCMKHTIRGETLPVLDVELAKGESVYSEAGDMAWKTPNVSMQTSRRGGFMKSLRRTFGGETLFMTTYTCDSGTGLVSFTNEFPGTILSIELSGQTILAQHDAFMCATEGVDLDIQFQRSAGAAFFGGEGFILEKVSGTGQVWLQISGQLTEYTLTKDQQLQVDPGFVGAFEDTVQYDIQRIKGFKNMVFSGEGVFLATLTGSGKVWLQSMTMHRLARRLAPYLPKKG